ncbi:MAG: GNAT family N-acetyltransferase [Gimesia chilikensis]|uniref:GNAT family N-acetyltransferase n=1 Tax=Gimesia chilikensis TaxID=2605989 RepID=UPI0011ED530E|nr:GNAT family N-acetyltransferase [Gimesia chilikensis]KAA0134554.1 GNAT family N-acetyltransferase [Gimesia chilikensis]
MKIRPYQPTDLDTLKAITVEAFQGVSIDQGIEQKYGLIQGHDWKWRKAGHVAADADREPTGIFVAELDDKIVGYISTWHDLEAGIGYIPNMAFVPECRGQGMGRKLLEYALAHFRELGLSLAKIETLEQNAVGNHLYTSLGFQEVARQIHFVAPLNSSDSQSSA